MRKMAVILKNALFMLVLASFFLSYQIVTAQESADEDDNLVDFGHYEQDGNLENGPEPIRWRVLSEENGKALLLSEYGLDTKSYNEEWEEVTWEECTLRNWLNDDFYRTAFSEEQQNLIMLTQLINKDNLDYNINGGNDTEDKIFLLSIEEVGEYFSDDESRKCYATQYARNIGADVQPSTGASSWWLRSPGYYASIAAVVNHVGWIYTTGYRVYFSDNVVRPAMWIIL